MRKYDKKFKEEVAKLQREHPAMTGHRSRSQTAAPEIPNASDGARYKALGNSVAIPCVCFVLRGIAYFFTQNQKGEGGKRLMGC